MLSSVERIGALGMHPKAEPLSASLPRPTSPKGRAFLVLPPLPSPDGLPPIPPHIYMHLLLDGHHFVVQLTCVLSIIVQLGLMQRGGCCGSVTFVSADEVQACQRMHTPQLFKHTKAAKPCS